jgi:anti-sigma B factor antagonist
MLAAVHPGEIGLEQRDSGVVIVSLRGEHDLTTAPDLRERVEEAIGAGSGLLIDLTEAEFIDSSVIGVVLEGQRRAQEEGTGFAAALEGGDPAVKRVLEVTGLDKNLPVHPSVETALDQVTAAPGARS